MKIEFKNVSFEYSNGREKVAALKNISLTINHQDFIVIYGSSGSGKTTLLKSLIGLIEYDGNIYFDEILDNSITTQERNLSYISQRNVLYPNLTIYDNIAFPLKIQKIPIDEIKYRVNEVVKMLDIEQLLTRKPKQISLGQQQQIAIAKAIIKKSEIYLFDEPFANIDYKKRVLLRQQLKKIHTITKKTFVLVTHDIEEALILGNKIVILEDGIVTEIYDTEEILKDSNSDFMKKYMVNKNEFL